MRKQLKHILVLLLLSFSAAGLRADDSLNSRLYKMAGNLSIQSAKDVKSIKEHFAKYKLNQKELVLVYAYWLMQNIDYDCYGFTSGTYSDKTTAELLRERKAVCYGYSKLFTELCNSSGIHTYLVKGFGKGYGYKPGKVPTATDHAWNLLKLDSSYYLFDITWASGYVQSKGSGLTYVRKPDPSNLFADPKQFVEKHFPVLPWFQLISPTVSAATFLGVTSIPARTDQSNKSISVDFKSKLDMLDTLSYIKRTATIAEEGEKYFSLPIEAATELSILAYNLITRNPGKPELLLGEKLILQAQKILQKLPNHKKEGLWKNLEQNLEYCRYKMESQ